MVRRNKTNYVIQSVAHSLDVLEQFFGDVDELGVTELSKRLKLHKNNVFRLLATLEARGYIEQNKATENYRLGIKCLHLGRRYIDHMGLVRQARPILSDVARRCRESTFVAIVRRDGVVPLESAEPDRPRGENHAADWPDRCRCIARRSARSIWPSTPRSSCGRHCPSSCRDTPTARSSIVRCFSSNFDAVARDGFADGIV